MILTGDSMHVDRWVYGGLGGLGTFPKREITLLENSSLACP